MNHLFAHNGIDHHNAAEATAHSAGDTAWKVVLVSVVVIAFLAIAVWAIKRFSTQTSTIKDKEK
jgi:hypothetical protein